MPELPEVETTRRGIQDHITGRKVHKVVIRQPNLRWKVDPLLATRFPGAEIKKVGRRGKYLLLESSTLTVMVHLGMSGSLRIVSPGLIAGKHDHVDIHFEGSKVLRYHDPRRFGSILLLDNGSHPLLENLGPEPLFEDFTAEYLYGRSRGRKKSVKSFIMDSHVVVGVGNIYACEALFLAGIRPGVAAGRISLPGYRRLVRNIQEVLRRAIEKGGTTLRDFVRENGRPGYFKQQLLVYGRGNQPCVKCETLLKEIRQSQRSTVYCPRCQR